MVIFFGLVFSVALSAPGNFFAVVLSRKSVISCLLFCSAAAVRVSFFPCFLRLFFFFLYMNKYFFRIFVFGIKLHQFIICCFSASLVEPDKFEWIRFLLRSKVFKTSQLRLQLRSWPISFYGSDSGSFWSKFCWLRSSSASN